MKLQHDIKLTIATGANAKVKKWANETWTWAKMANRLSKPVVTTETHTQFIKMGKADQGIIKDVGGYVGGYLREGKRSPSHVGHRQLLTLDIDFAHSEFWSDFTLEYPNAAVLHATHKHHPTDPRYRLVMPLDREVSPEEYQAIARRVAGSLGIDLFDNTTFETNRLMFWPSTPCDIPYYFEVQDKPLLCADEVLATYIDWRDTSLWPTARKVDEEVRERAKKMENPTEKRGIVGAFCRTYPITDAIEKFLSDVYAPATDGRYTYVLGSTASGLVIYDDLFAYSHHGTDPISGREKNAFDLVRIHKFGHLDKDSDERNVTRTKSYQAMETFALSDAAVKRLWDKEKALATQYDFETEPMPEEAAQEEPEEIDEVTWREKLQRDRHGKYLSSATNLSYILSNDPRLKNTFKYNAFDHRVYVCRTLPWRRVNGCEPIRDVDFAGLRNYLERLFDITGVSKIQDALDLECERNTFNPVQSYLTALKWDRVRRVDSLLVDYFGAPDTEYIREAMRKTLVGAVSRIFRPGCKFDTVLTLIGPQGCNKSTFIRMLGKDWHSDTFTTVQGKEAFEQLQGAWIIEAAEMAGMSKAEVEAVKHFVSKQVDQYRPAYGRTVRIAPRQSILIGSANKRELFKDATGNRRFWPVDVRIDYVTKDVWTHLETEVDQVWAEAVTLYHAGESLILSKDAAAMAVTEQNLHSETDERMGLVGQFLDTPLPKGWDKMGIADRKNYLSGDFTFEGADEDTTRRDTVCIAELWCECFGKNKEDMSRWNTRDLNEIMKMLPGWESSNSTKKIAPYGVQKYYQRVNR